MNLTKALESSFKTLFDSAPDWAWDIRPSIPFIGADFCVGHGLLVYASAENFSWMHRRKLPPWFETDQVWNRYRAVYEVNGRNSTTYFPEVGIAPLSDGGLLCAARYIAEVHGLPTAGRPREFLETLALSNWCKFSIRNEERKTNVDYLNRTEFVAVSLPYVLAELGALRPAIVMVPEKVWRNTLLSTAMRAASPDSHFVPCPQFNARVVNIHLRKYESLAVELRDAVGLQGLASWMRAIAKVNTRNAWRYIARLSLD